MFGTKKATNSPGKLVSKFAALGDANRFKIILILSENDDICVSEVAQKVGITTAGVSQHMRVLENAGLIKKLRKGQKICYQIDDSRPENDDLFKLIS